MPMLIALLWLGLSCLAITASEAEELVFGIGGNITWEGEVSGLDDVQTFEPEYRPSLDPNTTLIGIAPGERIELGHPDYPGAVLAKQLGEGENLSATLAAQIGTISTPTAPDINKSELTRLLDGLLAPDPTGEAFERKGNIINGTFVDVDLGVIVGVNRVSFFPRNTVFPAPTTPFENDFLRNFELRVHEGLKLNEAGLPSLGTWETFLSVRDNGEAVTVLDIDPPRYLRFFRLVATSSIPYEIEKLQIFGEGFFPNAQYLSPVVDLGTPSNWGQIRLQRKTQGEAALTDLIVRTRTGSDDTPFIYHRREVGNPSAEDIPFSERDPDEPLSRRDFLRLPVKGDAPGSMERGSIRDDLENWSPWSPPYSIADITSTAGARNTSPAPRAYIQFRVDFVSEELLSSNVLNSVAFDFTRPALADVLVAEVFPRQVEAARDISFVYAVRADMERTGLQGFNSFELSTPGRVERIERLEIIGSDDEPILDHTFAVQDGVTEEQTAAGDSVAITSITDAAFAVHFPQIKADDTLLKIHFVNRIFAYSTDFGGRALVQGTDAFQWVQSGNAAILQEGDANFESGITVLSADVTRTGLIGTVAFESPVFTPNGDGANDVLRMSFEVLTVVGEADIRAQLFDLGGRHRATIFEHQGANGTYTGADFPDLDWDGRDGQGNPLPPGIYLLRLEVEGDARSSATTRAVAIAY